MEARRQGLIVSSEGRSIEVCNGLLLVRFTMRDGGYVQEFCAANAKGEFRLVLSSVHKDLIPSSEHRVSDSPMFAGARPHLFSACRESLRMVFSEVQLHRPDENSVVVQLSGAMQGHSLVERLTIEAGNPVVHCEIDAALPGPKPALEYLMSSYAFLPGGRAFASGEEPDYTWAPNLRPSNDAVIGDLAFFSPAAIVQHGRYAAALLPDVEVLSQNRPMPASLDLDLTNGLLFAPLLSYGFCDYEPAAGGSYFRHDISLSRRLDTNHLRYAYDLVVDADCKRDAMAKFAARHLWTRYASATASRSHPVVRNGQSAIDPDACAAYGLWAESADASDENLVSKARAMRDAVLSAPGKRGLFATRYDRSTGSWRGCSYPDDQRWLSTAECSIQMYWLLRMSEDFESDPRTLRQAKEYADFLIASHLRSGAVPCWYDRDLLPAAALRSGAPTAASGIFLGQLAETTRLKKHLQAFAAAARFVIREVIPRGRFYDHTCISPDGSVSLECADPHTGMRPQSTQAMLWAAQLCFQAHRLLGDRAYLNSGLDVLDTICLMQSVGRKAWMPGHSGLLACGNACPRPDPLLSAEFALCAMEYGTMTGRAEYCRRAAAALRAATDADCDELTRARVAALSSVISKRFGAVYVSVPGRWSVELDGHRVEDLESQGSNIHIGLAARGDNSASGRIVFGGLRGKSYNVRVNETRRQYTREQMESGIAIEL